METTLVIMAAGISSRFGRLKQIEAVDNEGRTIIDYSVYDAITAGFNSIIFIIRREMKEEFDRKIGIRISKIGVESRIVYQDIDCLPRGYSLPKERKKPWGTAHAIACLDGVVASPFAVINADDYYGREAFTNIYRTLTDVHRCKNECCMIGYPLIKTLSNNGEVSRGICEIEGEYLNKIVETRGLKKQCDGRICSDTGCNIDADATVSMNAWGLTPEIVSECKQGFSDFLRNNVMSNPLNCEYFLPEVITSLIAENKIKVRVLDVEDEWYGMTYKKDKEELVSFLKKMTEIGFYPKEF